MVGVAETRDLDSNPAFSTWNMVFGMSKTLSNPACGTTVVTAVTLAIGGNGSKIAYFLHSPADVCVPHGGWFAGWSRES
jgi:hypothetical protein